ncbi:MAG: hypothetical protein RLY35_1938 [Bacteroidota bacterium]
MSPSSSQNTMATANDTITLGAGCFWCVEAAFMQLKGVVSAKSGYSGGWVKNPSYKEVCNGTTGHAEVVQIVFDSTIIDVPTILEAFFSVHDPTQLNRQGNDIGTQYRSAIFYHNDGQKIIAEKAVNAAEESHEWSSPIVTEIKPFEAFYPAEDYHDNYYNLNKDQPYCSLVITPKLNKFKKKFHQLIQE